MGQATVVATPTVSANKTSKKSPLNSETRNTIVAIIPAVKLINPYHTSFSLINRISSHELLLYIGCRIVSHRYCYTLYTKTLLLQIYCKKDNSSHSPLILLLINSTRKPFVSTGSMKPKPCSCIPSTSLTISR